MYLDNNFDFVDLFEKKIAFFSGSKYAISTDCASHALFLVLKLINNPQIIDCPKQTYFSVPMQILHAGYSVRFVDNLWKDFYYLNPLNIIDSAVFFKKNMYIKNTFQILSFQDKKRLSLGKGGMILTDSKEYYDELKKLRYDGRDLSLKVCEIKNIDTLGYHMYMTPETACNGLLKLNTLKNDFNNFSFGDYSDISDFSCFKNHERVFYD